MQCRKTLLSMTFLILLIFVWSYFANPSRHHQRLRVTGLNSHFTTPASDSFEQYVTTTQSVLKAAREKAGVNATDKVIAENSPAILLPDAACGINAAGKYQKGILLIHGLLDSGYAMQQLGKFFQSKCFIVYVVLLPGHGTTPGDLLQTNYHDWVAMSDFGVKKLSEKAEQIYVLGFSLGGLLAVNEALENPAALKAIILFAPALKLKSKIIGLTIPVYWLSRVFPYLQWWNVYGDSALTRYESLTLNSIYQTVKLVHQVQKKLTKQKLTIPVFIEQSMQDVTVDVNGTLDFFQINPNPYSRFLLYYEKGFYPVLHDTRIQLIQSTLEKQRILSMSHLSLTLSEDDPIYGIDGEYKDCLCYAEHSLDWQQCKSGVNTYLGEVTEHDLKSHIIQRIAFNPFYPYLLASLDRFISIK